jgi:hypothetical protein
LFFALARRLPAAKARVDALEATLEAKVDAGPARTTFVGFRSDLAREVRIGKLDGARLRGDVAAYKAADLGLRAQQIDAIRRLHDALDRAERAEVTKAMGASWKKDRVNAGALSSSEPEEAARRHSEQNLKQMRDALDLTDSQATQVRALLISRDGSPRAMLEEQARVDEASERQMNALLAEFQEDVFSVDDAPLSPIKNEEQAMINQIAFMEVLMPLLTPPQIVKLADVLDADPLARLTGRP